MASKWQWLVTAVICAGIAAPAAQAQAPTAPPAGARYVVAYIEVNPTAAAEGSRLVRQFRDLSRTERGNLRAEALQRIGLSHQFVLMNVWADQDAAEAHATAAGSVQFRDKLKAIENAPIDERVHSPLSVGPLTAGAKGSVIAVVTHVDVVPPQRDGASAMIKQLAEDSRKDDGNLRFEALTQVNRQNHFTLIEMWRNRRAADAHAMAAHTRAFREKLLPASGALYDERYYLLMN
jgi:quinol monooxygenase YgiN